MSFLRVLVVMQNVLRLWQKVATNPLNNIVHDNLPREKREAAEIKKQPRSSLHFTLKEAVNLVAIHSSVRITS